MQTVKIDFSVCTGKIKPMNGVNNGPMGADVRGISNFRAYADLEIPYARNHDASFFDGYGGEHTVDVHRIFKNFDADENDPRSYVFAPTDEYTLNTFGAGTKVFYRLGASIEHGYKYGTYPPKDFHKWARICEHIVRHYNEGWAGGFHLGIEYWEIWNEPDCRNHDGSNPCWQGTNEEFIELYAVAAAHLKKCFPHLKIGGPAFTAPKHGELQLAFLKAVKERNLPFDFYSFHRYLKTPMEIFRAEEMARTSLEMFDLQVPELILNEWNYIKGWREEEWSYSLRMEKSLKGASLVAGTMCAGQASGIDMLMYYDARPCGMCGLFDTDTLEPLKTYHTFICFRDLARLGNAVKTDAVSGDIYTCAARNDDRAAIMLTRYQDEDEDLPEGVFLDVSGFMGENGVRATFFLTDETGNAQPAKTEYFTAENFKIHLNMKLFDIYLIILDKM
jgi:hypothetical protein